MTILYSVVSVRSIHSHRMKGDTPIALNVHQNEKIDIDKVTSAPKGQFILNGCSFLLLLIDNLTVTLFFLARFFFPFVLKEHPGSCWLFHITQLQQQWVKTSKVFWRKLLHPSAQCPPSALWSFSGWPRLCVNVWHSVPQLKWGAWHQFRICLSFNFSCPPNSFCCPLNLLCVRELCVLSSSCHQWKVCCNLFTISCFFLFLNWVLYWKGF